jgi:hemolysin activation/secretion protein
MGAGCFGRWAAGAMFVLVTVASVGAALAQSSPTPFPGQPEPGRNIPAPAPPPPAPQFQFTIPAPRGGPVPRAVDQIQFALTDIKVVGATAFPPSAFRPLIAPLIGKMVKLSDITAVADKIEAMYRAKGYVLTRAYVPPQSVGNGVFTIRIVEGYVKAASVTGGDAISRRTVQSYVADVTKERPATLDGLERGLLLANGLPGTRASGLLRPSPSEAGASDLLVTLNQVPWQATVYADNRGSTTSGVVTMGAQAAVNSLPYIGGQFTFDASATPHFQERNLFQAHYARPVGDAGAVVSLSGIIAHGAPSGIAGGSVLLSDSYAIGTRLAYPLIVTRPLSVSVEGGLTLQGAKVTLPLAGAGGCDFSDDHWRTVDGAVTVQSRGLVKDSTTGVTLGLMQGLPFFGAESVSPCTGTPGKPTDFQKMTAVLQHDQPIAGPVSANFHALAQYGFEKLLIGEQTSFGGSGIGRGYDPAALAADSGLGLASELRYTVHPAIYDLDTAQFYGFVDVARTWNNHDGQVVSLNITNRQTLASVGFGVRVSLLKSLTGGIEFAHQLKGVPNNGGATSAGKTDSRILFNVAVTY